MVTIANGARAPDYQVSSVTSPDLTFTLKTGPLYDMIYEEMWIYYAIAPVPLTNEQITVTLNRAVVDISTVVFAIKGADTSYPFDLAAPATTSNQYDAGLPLCMDFSAASNNVACYVETQNSNDMILGFDMGFDAINYPIAGTGYTWIGGDLGQDAHLDSAVEYTVVSTPVTGLPVDFTTSFDGSPPDAGYQLVAGLAVVGA